MGVSKDPVRVAIHGASGRMGQALIRACHAADQVTLTAAHEAHAPDVLGRDASQLAGLDPSGVLITDDLPAALGQADVLIDFTRPDGTMHALDACRAAGVSLVSGTTGLDTAHWQAFDSAASEIAVLHAMNFSLGVAVLRALAEQAARMLGSAADAEIIEAHHRHKVDAPSGTALAVGESVAAGLGVALEDKAAWSRHGHTGERPDGAIGFSVIRGGDIVGEHTALFAMDGERVEIRDRMIFARGAVHAARWLATQPAGRYTIEDCLET